MRPAWVQVQVHPTLAESYRLYSLSKNLMEKEENGTGKCFSSSCVCLPRWRVNYQKSPSPSRNKWRERLVKRCRAPEERSSAWKQRVVVEKDVGSRPHIRGQKQRRIWGPGERHHPSLPSFTLQGGPCHHPSVPPFQSPASAPPEGLSPTFTSNSASVPWLRGPHQTPGRLHSPWSAGEEVEQGQLGNWTIVPPHARPWTGPSLLTSHDNLDTSLHVLIRSVRHWCLERFRDLSKVRQQAKGNEAQISSCVATWGTCHCPQRARWTLVPMYHCTQLRGYRAHHLCWGSSRPLSLFRKRLRARPPGKMPSRLHCVEHNDYIQISRVQNDVWFTRPLL